MLVALTDCRMAGCRIPPWFVRSQAGCSLENVVRTRMFVTDVANAEKVMAEHCKVFEKIRPAATILVVSLDMPRPPRSMQTKGGACQLAESIGPSALVETNTAEFPGIPGERRPATVLANLAVDYPLCRR